MKATRREWIGLAVLALPCILATMDLTVLNLAVPHLSADLKPSSSELLWILDIYGFWIAGALMTMGTLGDRIGRRRLLMMGAAAFGVASTLAAFSHSAQLLILSRALLGLAGATLAPSTLSLIRNMFHDPQERTVAIGIWVTCFSVGAAIGPLLGGILLEHFWWGSVFLLNVPVMILLLILGPRLLPEFRDPQAGRLDLPSAGLSLVSVLLVIYGLKRWAEFGLSGATIASLIIGSVIGGLFYQRQRQLSDPLIDVALFRVAAFRTALWMNLLACFVAFGAFLFTAQYLQLVMGLSPLHAGLWTTPSSAAFILGSMLTPPLARRLSPWTIMAGGLVLAAAGFGLLAAVHADSSLALIVAALCVYSLGISPIFTLSTELIVNSVPPERAGSAAGISETSTEFGGALGMAILGSLGMATYRHHIMAGMPTGLTPEALQSARSTLGGARAVAESLPAETGAALLMAAREAFTHALHFTAVANILIVAVMVGLAIRMAVVSDRKSVS